MCDVDDLTDLPELSCAEVEEDQDSKVHYHVFPYVLPDKSRSSRSISQQILAATMANDPVALQMHLMAATDEDLQFEDALTRSPAVVVAARLGYTGVLHMLLCKGASAERRDSNSGSTPLLHAAMHGHLDTVQLLLSWRVDINAQNDWGCTALMLAARYGQVATLKLLLLFHPDAKIIDKEGKTALDWAGSAEIKTLLSFDGRRRPLKQHPHVLLPPPPPPLHMSTSALVLPPPPPPAQKAPTPEYAALELALDRAQQRAMEQPMRRSYLKRRSHAKLLYASLDRTDADEIFIVSALRAGLAQMRAAYRKTAHLFEDLERMFPNPHHSGCTALHHAAMNGHAETVAMLVSYKANVNCKNDWGSTALAMASRNGHVAVCKVLIEGGTDLTLRDREGKTAKDCAATAEIRALFP